MMKKLLICDDEQTIRKGLTSIIEKRYSNITLIDPSANGYDAFQKILDHQPDVVLMDINMPGMSGLEVIEKSMMHAPCTKFIIVSGYDEFQYAQKAIRLNVSDYLLKPIDRQKLFETIDRLLRQAMQREIEEARTSEPLPLSLGQDATSYIYRHYQDTNLSLSMLSAQLHVSCSYLSKVIKKETEMSFSELLTKVRMETAITLLISHPQLSTLQVSEKTGYKNQHYFSKVFRQYTGLTPSEYREKHLKQSSRRDEV